MAHEVKEQSETTTRPPIAPERRQIPMRMPEVPPPRKRPVRWLYWMAGLFMVVAVGITVFVVTNEPERTLTYLDHTTYGNYPTEAYQVLPRPDVREPEAQPVPAPIPIATPLSYLDMYFPAMGEYEAFLAQEVKIDTTTQGLWPTEAWEALEWKGMAFLPSTTTGRWPNEAYQLGAWDGRTFIDPVTQGATAAEAYETMLQPEPATGPFTVAPVHYIRYLDDTTTGRWPTEAYQLGAWDGRTFVDPVTQGATAVEAYETMLQPEPATGPFTVAPVHYIRYLDPTTYGSWPTEAWQVLESKRVHYLPHETQGPDGAPL